MTNSPLQNWAMLAEHYDNITLVDYPRIGQPKANGICAKWDGERLVSRQGKVWSPAALPHLYEKLSDWSNRNPNVILTGELYCHGMPFQEIEARCAVKRVAAHSDALRVDLHAFDVVSDEPAEVRQSFLMHNYSPWLAVCQVTTDKEMFGWLKRFNEVGYEGIMLRRPGAPYRPGRSDLVIKVKPIRYCQVIITSCYEGQGKFSSMLGGFKVNMGGVKFAVGGGNITEIEREMCWKNRAKLAGQKLVINFRDTFSSGIPVQPQITKLLF